MHGIIGLLACLSYVSALKITKLESFLVEGVRTSGTCSKQSPDLQSNVEAPSRIYLL